MSFLGDLYSATNRIASQAKQNLKSVLVGTGDQIEAISSSLLKDGMVASVTADSTSGNLAQGQIVQWQTGVGWVTKGTAGHDHTSAAEGGTMLDIMMRAASNLYFANILTPTQEQFSTSGTGGSYTDVLSGTDKYLQVTTGATTNNSGNLHLGGVTLTFTAASNFVTRIKLASSTTSTNARVGINMEASNAVTDNLVKYGFEGCNTCNGTSVSIISSDGTTRSKNTTSADDYSNTGNYIMQLDPGVNVKYRKENGSIITKTTEPPSTGLTNRSSVFLAGLQNTGSTSRTLDLYGVHIMGQIGETNWPTIF